MCGRACLSPHNHVTCRLITRHVIWSPDTCSHQKTSHLITWHVSWSQDMSPDHKTRFVMTRRVMWSQDTHSLASAQARNMCGSLVVQPTGSMHSQIRGELEGGFRSNETVVAAWLRIPPGNFIKKLGSHLRGVCAATKQLWQHGCARHWEIPLKN